MCKHPTFDFEFDKVDDMLYLESKAHSDSQSDSICLRPNVSFLPA